MKAELNILLDGLDDSPDKLSKIGLSLNRLFKKSSIQGLSQRLEDINKKKRRTLTMKEIEEIKIKKRFEQFNIFDKDLDIESPKPNKKSNEKTNSKNRLFVKENKDLIGKIDLKKIDLKNKFSNLNNKALTERYHPIPEPGKYNPNYKSIEKKVPSIIFRKPLPKPLQLPSLKSNEPLSSDRKSTKMLDETIKTFENIKQSPSNKKSKTGFSLNLPRNDIMINRNESNILSYIEPEKINSRRSVQSLDFKRMRTRNFNDLLIQSKFNPGVATYNPNFDAVSSSRKQTIQSKNSENQRKSKLMIQKMWSSYSVSVNYQTVKLKSFLDEKAFKKHR